MVAVPHRDKAFSRSFKDNSDILCDARYIDWDYPVNTLYQAKEVLDHDFNSSHWIDSTQNAIENFSRNYNHHQLASVRCLILDILESELNLEFEADLKSYKYSSYVNLEFYLIAETLDGEYVLNKSKNFEYIIKKAKEAKKKLWDNEDFSSLYNSVKILIKEI
jgi:hypothetical protein